MEHIKILKKGKLVERAHTGGCGECSTSCQSAIKTENDTLQQRCENCKEVFQKEII